MAADRVDSATLVLSVALVALVELASHAIAASGRFATPAILAAGRSLQAGLLLGAIFARKKNLSCIGLDPSTVQTGIRKGLLWSAAFGVAAGVLAALSIVAGVDVTSMILPDVPSGKEEIVTMLLVVGVAAPVSEEIFFRGILYGFFRRWGVLAAVAASTVFFVAAHSTGGGFPLIPAAGGVALSLVYEKEKNLLVPAVVHVLGNLSLVIGGLLPRLLH